MSDNSASDPLARFNPDDAAVGANNIFGLPFNYQQSKIILLPVPWEATVSYGSGASEGPAAILKASAQVDLYDRDLPDGWNRGIFMAEAPDWMREKNLVTKSKAMELIHFFEEGGNIQENPSMQNLSREINDLCAEMNVWVFGQSLKFMSEGKLVGLVGGDHSTPLGYIQALSQSHRIIGILQIDAHCDLRIAYEGMEFSHASIMYNSLKLKEVTKLVQVGIRDYSPGEVELIKRFPKKIHTFFDHDIKANLFEGNTWREICKEIISQLPREVYVSFDIDGLDPSLCPGTGTPVAGGLQLEEIYYLLKMMIDSGRKIIGFDLCEVGPGNDPEWNGNVGARVLFRLCNLMLKSNRL